MKTMKYTTRLAALVVLFGTSGVSSTTRAADIADLRAKMARAAVLEQEAAIRQQQAYSLYLQNRRLAVQTIWDVRSMRDRARAEEQGALEARVDHDRQRRQERERLAAARTEAGRRVATPLERPEARQLDATGKIHWPNTLRRGEYTDSRTRLDSLFAERARADDSGEGSANCDAVQVATSQMLRELATHIGVLPPREYLAAQQFVRNLANEARFPSPRQIALRDRR